MAGADREMKGVPCANIKLRLSGVAGRGVEILALDGKNPKAFRAKPGEGRKRGCAMIGAETADARLIDSAEANSVTALISARTAPAWRASLAVDSHPLPWSRR